MKHKLIIVLLIILTAGVFYNSAVFGLEFKQDKMLRNEYFFRAGYNLPIEEQYSGGLTLSGGITLPLMEKLKIEAEGLLTFPQSDFTQGGMADSVGTGNLTLISLNLNLDYYVISSSSLGLYLKAGVGYSFNSFSPSDEFSDLGFEIDENLDNTIQFSAGIGADFPLSESNMLNLDIRCMMNSLVGTWSVRDEISETVISGKTDDDLFCFIIQLGIKI
jgi:outer membrane protein W